MCVPQSPPASQVQGRPGRLPALPPAVLCTVYAGGEHHKEPVPGARSHRFSPARNHSPPHRRHGRMSITVRSAIWLHPTDTAPSLSFFRDPSPGRGTETIPAESGKKKKDNVYCCWLLCEHRRTLTGHPPPLPLLSAEHSGAPRSRCWKGDGMCMGVPFNRLIGSGDSLGCFPNLEALGTINPLPPPLAGRQAAEEGRTRLGAIWAGTRC